MWRAFKMLLAVILGAIYLPLNMLLMWVADETKTMKKDEYYLWLLVQILLFPLWLIAVIFSAPYEILLGNAH